MDISRRHEVRSNFPLLHFMPLPSPPPLAVCRGASVAIVRASAAQHSPDAPGMCCSAHR